MPPACSVNANATTASPVGMAETIAAWSGRPKRATGRHVPFVRCTSIRPAPGPAALASR